MKSNILGKLFGSSPAPESPYTDPTKLAGLIQGRGAADALPFHLVDVRSAEEYATGHIPTAVNIPVHAIGSKVPTQDKEAQIVVYCLSGGRSQGALETLQGMGYKNVVNFGGVSRWRGELVRGSRPTA